MESITQVLAEGAVSAGHDVSVVCFTRGRSASGTLQGVRVQRAAQLWESASQPLSWAYVRMAWRAATGAHLVHLHAPNMVGAFVATFLPRRVMLLVHWHSDIVGKGLLGALVRPLERALLRRADSVVATSPPYATASPLLRDLAAKLSVVPLGIPEPLTPTADESARDFAPFLGDRKLVLGLGRLVPYKGFAVLIEAAATLPDDCVVVIGGAGPLSAELHTQVQKLGLQGRVLLAGRLGEVELERLFHRASVFCLPSVERSEAFGVVLLEAMARMVPCVATRIEGSGTAWVNEEGVSGLNVAPGDAQALAAALARVCGDDELRARLAHGARRRWEQQFTAAGFVRAFDETYRSLATTTTAEVR